MDFATETVMEAVTPPTRGGERITAQAAEAEPSFDDHLEAISETPEREAAPGHTPAPKPDGSAESTLKAQPQSEIAAAELALVGGPAPAPIAAPIAAPVVVQIAASAPAPQKQQQMQPQPAAPAEAPVAPTARVAATPPGAAAPLPVQQAATAPNETIDGSSPPARNPVAYEKAAPVNTAPQAAPQTAQPVAAPTRAQQPVAQTPISMDSLQPELRAAVAATVASAPEVLQHSVQRGPKVEAAPKQAPEIANARGSPPAAPIVAVRGQSPNRAATAAGVVKDIAAPAPAQSATSDGAQAIQTNAAATTTAQTSTHLPQAAADMGAQRATPAAAQVAREIVRRFDGANTSFELRLDPPELGRVEVRMEVSRDHRVTAVIAADSAHALSELARHARELEQQLQSAGLQLSDNGLSFDLRQGAHSENASDASNPARDAGGGEDASAEQTQTRAARPIGLERWRGVRVDMMV